MWGRSPRMKLGACRKVIDLSHIGRHSREVPSRCSYRYFQSDLRRSASKARISEGSTFTRSRDARYSLSTLSDGSLLVWLVTPRGDCG
jgi:hypothetical protein